MQRVSAWVKAVDDVSFHIYEGESFGLVGESGCGKTTVGRTLLHLIPPTDGKVYFDGRDIFQLSSSDLMDLRRNMQIIFQDPFSSLDPRMPVGESIAEGLKIHTDMTGEERYNNVVEMLARVGMRADHARRYPHEFSGGQRQRILLEGDVPSPLNPPSGCRFHTPCPLAFDKCSQEEPQLKDYGVEHFAACWLLETGIAGASKISEEYRKTQAPKVAG
jgi:oligopeptide/dipeptide ABC transporter ATP-binding protein